MNPTNHGDVRQICGNKGQNETNAQCQAVSLVPPLCKEVNRPQKRRLQELILSVSFSYFCYDRVSELGDGARPHSQHLDVR